jgi:hypothetical protein
MQLDFNNDGSGQLTLLEKTYERAVFSDMVIAPPIGTYASIVNCVFKNCETSPGTCLIRSNVSLENVSFIDFDCGDALRISSGAKLRKVTIAGRFPRMLIVRPEEGAVVDISVPDKPSFNLDISKFTGTVEIIGYGGPAVKKDPSRHVTVEHKWKSQVDWKSLGIGLASYWRVFLSKLSSFGAEQGVFSLPEPSSKKYSEALREMELLASHGIKFD